MTTETPYLFHCGSCGAEQSADALSVRFVALGHRRGYRSYACRDEAACFARKAAEQARWAVRS